MRSLLSFIFLLFLSSFLRAQLYIPFGSDAYFLAQRLEIKSGNTWKNNFHSSSKPYTYQSVLEMSDSVTGVTAVDIKSLKAFYHQAFFYTDSGKTNKATLRYFYSQKAFLYSVNTDHFKLSINPVLYFAGATETGNISGNKFNETLYINTRGAELQGIIDNKVSFYAFVTDNQMRVPLQTKLFGDKMYALPGESYYKNFKGNGVDFFHAEGYVAAPLTKHISMQLGTGKQFIGDGIRSLILSDFSKPHLFLKLNTKVWKLNYQNLFYELTDSAFPTSASIYKKKFGATHHLSINAGKNFTIGLFETVIFKRDNNAYELNYLNPIIFYRAAEHSLGSPDNVILGLDFKWNIKNCLQFYGQFVFDEFLMANMRTQFFSSKSNPEWGWWGNKYSAQVGLKAIDLFRIKNLDMQLEYNHIRPYTYGYTYPSLNYTDFNQSMAHPLGANLKEILVCFRFKPTSKITFKLNTFTTRTGIDTSALSYGADLLKSSHDKVGTYGNFTGQGLKTMMVYYDIQCSYQMLEGLFLDLGFTYRKRETAAVLYNNQNQYFMLGLRLNAVPRDFMY